MLIRKKNTKKTTKNSKSNRTGNAYDPNLGSRWAPGISDGSYLWPDTARVRIVQGTDGVWRPEG